MQRFRADLRTVWGLAIPKQCCHAVTKLMLDWFVGGFLGKKPQTYMITIIVLPYYMWPAERKPAIFANSLNSFLLLLCLV